ncbi:MAG: 30S ribosomal protein S7 [Chloroflexi bacterium]|nr:30S ribosomal protein S7 [Chloroflexota bacterium]
MSRRARAEKRPIAPDTKYDSVLATRMINRIMTCGKKRTAEKILYDAMQIIEQKEGKPPLSVLEEAVKNTSPLLQVKARRVGGATYQVPVEVPPDRSMSLALRWLVGTARNRGGHSMAEKLAAELSDAAKGQGVTVKKREDTHKMAEANRAFAHYRW